MKHTSPNTIYLDHAATTPLDLEVFDAMIPHLLETYGNPSSIHHQGRRARQILEEARRKVAETLGCAPREIIFTGSGTESDNTALYGISRAYRTVGRHIIVSVIEHKAVLAAAHDLEKEGFRVTYLPVDSCGQINVDECIDAIEKDTILISIHHANNEIGTIEPIGDITARVASIRKDNALPLVHTDACQSVGQLDVRVDCLAIDLMTINSSKIYGPKGIGLLYVKDGVQLSPTIVGGSQEYGKRAGTENVALAVGFAHALEKACREQAKQAARMEALRTYFLGRLKETISDIVVNGHTDHHLPNNIHVSIPHIEGESLVLMLDSYGICTATGSACSSHDLAPSHVLRAIGLSHELIHGSIRITLGKNTTTSELDQTLEALHKCVHILRASSATTIRI